MMAKTPRFAAVIACIVVGSDAFAPSLTGNPAAVNSFRSQAVGPLFADGDGPKDATTLTKALVDLDSGCAPDDEYCVVDKETGELVRLTLEEKERIFMDALQSYYVSGRQLLNDQDFDSLKEDLAWNGSKMVNMNRQETKYLAAVQSYLKGTPTLSDEEFDSLKEELKEEKSKFASSKEPKC